MKQTKLMAVVFLGFALVVTGCSKKSSDQANLSGTGFDSLSTTEELAQLPQSTTSNQQASVEVLPIETAPVTQAAGQTSPAITQAASTIPSVASNLSRDQQIQTALKNAGLYQGNIDGKLGPKTKKAIEQFQTNNGLKADGKVGPKTWTALQQYLTGQTSSGTTTAPATE